MRHLGTALAWIAAVLLVFAVFGASRSDAQDKGASSDASITRQVKRVLGKEATLARVEIYVETRDGVVNLTGFVRSLEQIAKAGELTRAVAGVNAVRNGLRVANQPSRA